MPLEILEQDNRTWVPEADYGQLIQKYRSACHQIELMQEEIFMRKHANKCPDCDKLRRMCESLQEQLAQVKMHNNVLKTLADHKNK